MFAAIPFAGADAAVIVDPPRKGCGDAFLAQLAAFAPRTIVYVSCNPETQARDIAVLRRRRLRLPARAAVRHVPADEARRGGRDAGACGRDRAQAFATTLS